MTDMLSTGYVSRRNAGQSFASIFNNGCIEIRSGAQPVNADAPVTGTLLARITRDGGAWAAGMPNNGLQFEAGTRYVSKLPDHIWRLVGIASGNAGWCRLVANPVDSGLLSTDAPRIDGAVGLVDGGGNFQMYMPVLAITPDLNVVVPHYWRGTPPVY